MGYCTEVRHGINTSSQTICLNGEEKEETLKIT